MRTLKKALSLVLVLAMVLSLGVTAFAANAKDFKDYGSVQNKEAVDVMVAIDVISGRDDGTYDPTAKFTRAEAATMIARLMLGKTVAEALPASATQFNDVPATHWASKYVQYCANEGIINGYGDGKFGPNDTLTANQWALMLLGALGYKAENENIGGSGWEIQVTKLAISAKVASADELTATFNRDMAAKMALNTLLAETVSYSSNGITINGSDLNVVVGASKAEKSGDTYMSVNYPKLTRTAVAGTTVDGTGAPAAKWKNDKTDIGTYAIAPTLTYTSSVTEKALYQELGAVTLNVKTIGVDGNITDGADITLSGSSDNTKAAPTGNGVVTNIYKQEVSGSDVYTMVCIQPEFTKVTNIREVKANSSHGAYTEYTVSGATGSPFKIFSTIVDKTNDKTTAVIDGTVAKNDQVLCYVDGNGVAHIEAVDTVSGTVTSANTKNSVTSYTIDGTVYNKAAAYETINGKDIAVSDKSGEYYVDSYGYILGVKEATAATNYAYVIKTEESAVLNGNKVETVYNTVIAKPDGTVETISVAKTSKDVTGVVTYVLNDDGLYDLTALTGDRVAAITKITAKNNTMETSDTVKFANNNTVFVRVNYAANAKNVREPDGTVTVVTGINNVSTFATLSTAYAVSTASTAGNVANVVYIVDDTAATVSNKYTYVMGTYSETTTQRIYDVIVDGEETTLTTGKAATVINAGLYQSIVVSGNTVTATKATAEFTSIKFDGGMITLSDGTVQSCGDTVPVYTIDSAENTVTTSTAADLTETVTQSVALSKNAEGTITAIYLF